MRIPSPERSVVLELYRPSLVTREFELAASAQCFSVAEAHRVIRANRGADLAIVTWREKRWSWLRVGNDWRRIPLWSVQDVPYTTQVRVTVTRRPASEHLSYGDLDAYVLAKFKRRR